MDSLIKFGLVAAVVAVAIGLLRPRCVFLIKIRAGKVQINKGKLPRKFIEDCQNIVSECNVRRATIKGVSKSGRISLHFSRQIPRSYHQRFRNVWSFHT